jgi:GAF domain-containing protein
VVQVVIDGAREITGAAFGAFFYNLVDADGESYTLYRLSGAPPEAFALPHAAQDRDLRADLRRRGPGAVGRHHPGPALRPQHSPRRGMPEGHLPVRSYLAIPVATRQGEVLGGLFFGHPEPGRFSARDENLLIGLGAQVAVTIESIQA